MDKIAELLGPWPILQLIFGIAVLGVGVYALMRGLAAGRSGEQNNIEDVRQQWEAFNLLRDIAHHTEQIAENQKLMLDRIQRATEAINSMVSVLYNRDRT